MRFPSLVVGLLVTTGVVACLASPDMVPLADPGVTATPSLTADASDTPDGAEPTVDEDASVSPDPPEEDNDAGVPDQPGPPDPPGTTCPPVGAPTGTACCGAGGAPPPCVGEACKHCGDCAARKCGGGSICCAYTSGKSKKYKGILCAATALAHLCP